MSLLARFFNSERTRTPNRPKDDLEELVHRYGEIVETSKTVIDDVARLPLSKEEMKGKLLYAIKLTSVGKQREFLKAGYVLLSNFQPLSVTEWNAVQAYNQLMSQKLDSNDLSAVKAHLGAITPVMEIVQPLLERQAKESEVLLSELRAAGA